ncbi:DUF4826 family protein [Aliiglaciecola sp. CAU 1673]|uniref:DUF4826 family protein n=1 Tax=Aliiglaciecola sp. CAU 1673 TaxID=3032595 RepID=UPI0023DA6048|nr:DUF4826 family protein [Aliiglaciecola sp. CAU 1673]MDF2177726.1 DUF4826 family protein [Aliiglaciecola sp. CAU 1673]
MTKQVNLTQEQLTQWVREQFQKTTKFLAEEGILVEEVVTQESRYLAPVLAVWKVKARDGKKYWAIGGDVPSDVFALSVAKDAREVLRYASLHWQLKAENLSRVEGRDKTREDFIKLLVSRAQGLYQMSQEEGLWQNNA